MSPAAFNGSRPVGYTPANKTIGKKIGSDNVLGRVCEVSYKDLNAKSNFHWRKVRMQVETVEGKNCYSSFYGLGCTAERISSLLKKNQTTINIWCDVKTKDGYILRIFVTSCTVRKNRQRKNNCYAKASQLKIIRKRAREHLVKFAQKRTHTDLANAILNEAVSKNLIKNISKTFPVKVVLITKVKVLKKANIDVHSLLKEAKQATVKETTTKGANDLIDQAAKEVENAETEEKTEEAAPAEEKSADEKE